MVEHHEVQASNLTEHHRYPILILGPGDKTQTDDPFLWLLGQFHEALQRVQTCIVVGFGWHDPHIAGRIRQERQCGLDVIDVGFEPQDTYYPLDSRERGRYLWIRSSAASALANGSIHNALERIHRDRSNLGS